MAKKTKMKVKPTVRTSTSKTKAKKAGKCTSKKKAQKGTVRTPTLKKKAVKPTVKKQTPRRTKSTPPKPKKSCVQAKSPMTLRKKTQKSLAKVTKKFTPRSPSKRIPKQIKKKATIRKLPMSSAPGKRPARKKSSSRKVSSKKRRALRSKVNTKSSNREIEKDELEEISDLETVEYEVEEQTYEVESEVYEVEKICNIKFEHGQEMYLVKWKGYGMKDNTWEPLENLDNANEAIDAFHSRHTYEVEYICGSRQVGGKRQYYVKWKGWPTSSNTWEPRASLLKGARHEVMRFEKIKKRRMA